MHMNAIIMGMGQQGKAVIHDLESCDLIKKIVAMDIFSSQESKLKADKYITARGYLKTSTLNFTVNDEKELAQCFAKLQANIVICMLPIELAVTVARAALLVTSPFVSSNYTYDLAGLHDGAVRSGTTILPEMGLDPGIDLILGRLAIDELDVVHGMYSYGGGIPAPECADTSPIRYKISWTFDRVLDVYVRQAELMKNGRCCTIPGKEIFCPENFHEIEFATVGRVEAYPNGDALRYIDIFELGPELQEMGRFALRWPGHAQFWRTMVQLGLLDEKPIEVEGQYISPRAFLARCLPPNLQFAEEERDVALLRVVAWGLKDGQKYKVIYDLIDYRDIATGLFAMNRTVGFTTSIAAQMILAGKIRKPGVLSPVRHVPCQDFLEEITRRGITINKVTP